MAATHSKLWHLEKINLLKELSHEELEEIDRKTTMKTSSKGEYIYFPDEPSKIIFFLKKGRVKIGTFSDEGKEIIKAILYPGEIFGELAIAGQEKRRDFAMAMDAEVDMCAMNVNDIKEMMKSNPGLSLKVTAQIGERLLNMERKLESLIFKDARTRIIDFLIEMAEKHGQKIGDEILIKHNITHQDMANLTATSRQTVTTILNELRDQDLIYMERKKILIRDINKLQ